MNATLLVESLSILMSYGDVQIQPGHDKLYAGPDLRLDAFKPEDIKRLDELGWFWDHDEDCWVCFT